MRVLIETRTPGEDLWMPEATSRVYGETEHRFLVRRHWWLPREWLPKDGPFCRLIMIEAD